MKSILVIFGKDFPKKSKKWLAQFDEVLGLKELEELIDPGSVQEACQLVDKLSQITLPDGKSLPKIIAYQGYEFWWVQYDSLMDKFCLPYTQYRRLLEYLKEFEKIYLYRAPYSGLFQCFLDAYGRKCVVLDKLSLVSLGVLVQAIFSLPFLLWLKLSRAKLMVWTSDQFDPAHPPHDYDFRMRFIYNELRERKVPFIEFIRSVESLSTVLQHILKRKRPVVYSAAIIDLLYYFAQFFRKKEVDKIINSYLSLKINPEDRFWFLVATCYIKNSTGTIWSIRAMKLIIAWLGIRAAIIPSGCSRTFHEILACKLLGIKTIGIQHGITPRYYAVYEFMPGFDSKDTISVDMLGLWSNWWREYYICHSRAYRPEQLYVSGHMRPLTKEVGPPGGGPTSTGPLKVLFVSEHLAAPSEVTPYLSALLEVEGFSIFLKCRSYRDGFEDWLGENKPEILKRIKILKTGIHEAISQVNLVVGSHSTSVLEALLQFKPFVYFQTKKWGDYLEMKSLGFQSSFFAENPEELVKLARESLSVPREILAKMQNRFFGDPYQNGSKWVVEQAIKELRL